MRAGDLMRQCKASPPRAASEAKADSIHSRIINHNFSSSFFTPKGVTRARKESQFVSDCGASRRVVTA
jgi:hypothetical protein